MESGTLYSTGNGVTAQKATSRHSTTTVCCLGIDDQCIGAG